MDDVKNIVDRYPEDPVCDELPLAECKLRGHPIHVTEYENKRVYEHCELPTDDGRMEDTVQELRDHVVGRKIVRAWQGTTDERWPSDALFLELDNGKVVQMADTDDCCAHTTLHSFLLHPESVDHMILGVGTEEGFTTWHVYADFGDVLSLGVSWSCGNPYYYDYGFDIKVKPLTIDGEVVADRPQLKASTPAIEA